MNIRDEGMWPQAVSVPTNSQSTWLLLLDKRHSTAKEFLRQEEEKGFIAIPTSLNTARGQDMIRLLLFRTIEELVESYQATEHDHVREELIDALFFALEIAVLDDWKAITKDQLSESLFYAANRTFNLGDRSHDHPWAEDISDLIIEMGKFGDTLRNRSWMKQSQSTYFDGVGNLILLIMKVATFVMNRFSSFKEFWQFYVAKDNVLQFRIRSNY